MKNSYQNKQKKKGIWGNRDNVKNTRKLKNHPCHLYPTREQKPYGIHEKEALKRIGGRNEYLQ